MQKIFHFFCQKIFSWEDKYGRVNSPKVESASPPFVASPLHHAACSPLFPLPQVPSLLYFHSVLLFSLAILFFLGHFIFPGPFYFHSASPSTRCLLSIVSPPPSSLSFIFSLGPFIFPWPFYFHSASSSTR